MKYDIEMIRLPGMRGKQGTFTYGLGQIEPRI